MTAYTKVQNHRLVIASSAPTEAVDPPWMKQSESERIFFSLWGSEWPSGRIFTLSFFLGGEAALDCFAAGSRRGPWCAESGLTKGLAAGRFTPGKRPCRAAAGISAMGQQQTPALQDEIGVMRGNAPISGSPAWLGTGNNFGTPLGALATLSQRRGQT
jgi:hypothetical protein